MIDGQGTSGGSSGEPSKAARIERLVVGGAREVWERLGLTVTADGVVPFLATSIRIDEAAPPGLARWELSGIDASIERIDGLPTVAVDAQPPLLSDHPNGASGLDHVVVLTSSLDRTCGAVADATGAPLRRVREVGSMRQGFHRVGRGGLIIEVVERAEFDAAHAEFWGLVVNVDDLDAAVTMIGGELIGDPIDAVQPGRRIATVRRDAGLGLPVAFMSTG